MITISKTELSVYPLCLGGNVFGWSADRNQSFDVLDAFLGYGGNFIDTADVYSAWKEGNVGGESESIIGAWMKERGNRDSIVVATKVAKLPTRAGLSKSNIIAAAEDSLRRLQSDHIDLYYAHEDDERVPQEEYLAAFDHLVTSGKVRYIAASNFSGDRLTSAAQTSRKEGLASFVAIQNHFNLLERKEYEELVPTLNQLKISGIPYFGLARGFLTGKYRDGVTVQSVRAGGVSAYQNSRGYEMVERLEGIAHEKGATISQVALAWLRAQPTIAAPIASARTVEQLHEIAPLVTLSEEELALLSK
jgi:aryl-alcohol dehydrogenase-like predicted oxidoreductase